MNGWKARIIGANISLKLDKGDNIDGKKVDYVGASNND